MDTMEEESKEQLRGRDQLSLHHINVQCSPSVEKKRLEHKWRIEDEQYHNTWKSCLGCETDRRAVQYFTQIVIISFVMVFCVYQLTVNDDCPNQQTYTGLLTLLLGLLIPNPSIKDKPPRGV